MSQTQPRRIAMVSTSRADHSGYLPLVKEVGRRDALEGVVILTSPTTADAEERTEQWREAGAEVHPASVIGEGGTRHEAATAMAAAAAFFAEALDRIRPDLAVVYGDRYEMHAAAATASILSVAIAHIHGGEVTVGAMDDALRHSITKLSHLHFVATAEYGRRVRQMGEEDWRITVSGAPALDNLREMSLPSANDLMERLGIPSGQPPILVTFHPPTLELHDADRQLSELLDALDRRDEPLVFTAPNADPKGIDFKQRILAYVERRGNAIYRDSLGTRDYLGLMAHALVMVGNSSSGLIEAPSLGLPVVNIGSRQAGRVRARNVIDAGNDRGAIADAIAAALAPSFRAGLHDLDNPYGTGRASGLIVDRLESVAIDEELIKKRFEDRAFDD